MLKGKFFKGIFYIIIIFFACSAKPVEIGVVAGTEYERIAREYSDQVSVYIHDSTALLSLKKGEVDCLIMDRLGGLLAIKEGEITGLEQTGSLLAEEKIALALRKEDEALREALEQALAEIIMEGTYRRISKKYFGADLAPAPAEETLKPTTDKSLQQIIQAGEIRMVISNLAPPFSYYDKHKLTGFDVELGLALAQKLGVNYTPVHTNWSKAIEGLLQKSYDVVWRLSVTEERQQVVNFTLPYLRSGPQLIVRTDSPLTGWEDLEK